MNYIVKWNNFKMLHQVISYFKFLFHSKTEHGIHSPFVFDLITKCFYDHTKYPEYDNLKSYRKTLLENKNKIVVTDFGAGSKVFSSNIRSVAKIVQTAGIKTNRAELLFRIVRYFKSKHILELGTSLGLATYSLTLGNPESLITTLEGCKNTQNIAKINFEKHSKDTANEGYNKTITNVNFITQEFSDYLKTLDSKSYDLIYFD
ncbi:MAG TPA: hypothetical protein DDZ41_09580, partial [Flavobacterium sp.]|nr:hypothetical protein [Flavobacterium sp.]